MDFAIPISRFDPKNIRLEKSRMNTFQRSIPFAYEDNNIMFNNVIVVLHSLKVIDIDIEKKQLFLEESTSSTLLSRLEQFQTNISNELEKNSKKWVEESKLPSVVKNPLQQWIKGKHVTLYLSADPSSLVFFSDKGRITFSSNTLQPGDTVRAIVKIHGLSLQMSEADIWTGKSRIQHHILQLYKCSS
jgi:Rad3-related DNA helicase